MGDNKIEIECILMKLCPFKAFTPPKNGKMAARAENMAYLNNRLLLNELLLFFIINGYIWFLGI